MKFVFFSEATVLKNNVAPPKNEQTNFIYLFFTEGQRVAA